MRLSLGYRRENGGKRSYNQCNRVPSAARLWVLMLNRIQKKVVRHSAGLYIVAPKKLRSLLSSIRNPWQAQPSMSELHRRLTSQSKTGLGGSAEARNETGARTGYPAKPLRFGIRSSRLNRKRSPPAPSRRDSACESSPHESARACASRSWPSCLCHNRADSCC